ncbi:GxxExxY protein [Stieleria sp. JC731]|uniref:GxxExxY protein n=1 Tax=Pirellulaceae TaxID=2691357 RepID=UPI001E3A9798|nr:GxxExxY protein [Stieleria sp. JC731]MCC9602464.1 GxxExxY protein [Stieleria sp. JC731]
MSEDSLTREIIGAAIEVHKNLGPGLLESAYRACLAYELRNRQFDVEEEYPVPLIYGDVKMACGYRADLLVDHRRIVEIKAKSAIHPVDKAQTLSHLRLLDLRFGLLINFHVPRLVDGINRIVNGYGPERFPRPK